MIQYLLEIKNRSVLIFITFFSTAITSYYYKDILLFTMLNMINFSRISSYFIFTDIAEIFIVYIELIRFLSLQITALYLIYHIFIFFCSAFFKYEYRSLKFIFKIMLFVWFFSLVFSTYYLIPFTYNFFLSFQNLSGIGLNNFHFEAKLIEYLNFYIILYSRSIVYCQSLTVFFIVIIYFHSKVVYFKKFRKVYYYFLVLISFFMSPPEAVSLIFISFFSIVIYEIFVLVFILIKILIR